MTATIKDVARRANTSTATVSKVMNGSYSISQATIDRVNQAMEELDYHPNMRAMNFSKQKSGVVIWISVLEKNSGFTNQHMFEIMCGLEKTLAEKGYMLIVKSMTKEDALDFVKEVYRQKQADGFVIHASVASKELDALIEKEQIPHLVVGMPDFISSFCWIDVDNRLAGQMAAKYLLEKDYQKVSFIGGTEEDKISMHRLEGVMAVLNEHDLILPKNHLYHGKSDCDSGYEMTKELVASGDKPDAIICANNYIAYGCIEALKDLNIKIPEDMGVISFDEYPFSKILKPELTVVNIDVYDLGIQAGKYINQKIKKNNLHIQSYITVPNLVERASTMR